MGTEEQEKKGCEEAIRHSEVAFSSFILSLGTSAMLYLGFAEDPTTGKKEVNLPMARHVIDTLAMLKEKTKGNLEEDEEKLIDTMLFDLRLKFVEVCERKKAG
jgi:hypothetical protein